MNQTQQNTGAVVRDCIVECLERAASYDENIDMIREKCETTDIDTGACDVELLFNDPKVQEAFKKFISKTVGTFQYAANE